MVNVNRIKAIMARRGQTNFIKDLADLFGSSPTNASYKLRNMHPWKYVEMEKFAQAYGLTQNEFMQVFFPQIKRK